LLRMGRRVRRGGTTRSLSNHGRERPRLNASRR